MGERVLRRISLGRRGEKVKIGFELNPDLCASEFPLQGHRFPLCSIFQLEESRVRRFGRFQGEPRDGTACRWRWGVGV